jgi:hypothetical protein
MITLEKDSRITFKAFRKKFVGHKEWMFSHYHREKFIKDKRKEWEKYSGQEPKAIHERQKKVHQMWRDGVSNKEIRRIVKKTFLTPSAGFVDRDKTAVLKLYYNEAWRLNRQRNISIRDQTNIKKLHNVLY